MNVLPSDNTEYPPGAPPPGCPAHIPSQTDGMVRLYGAEYKTDAMAVFEKLRAEHGSVAPVLLDGDLQGWLVLGYNEIMQVARTPSLFSRDTRRWRDLQDGKVAPDSPLLPIMAWQPVCVFADGEEHERLRLAVTESFARLDRRGMRRHVTRFAHQLVDRFVEQGKVELVRDFAEPLPMLVLTQLMGMPDEYGPQLLKASSDLVKGSSETAVVSNAYVVETLQQLVKRKRAAPGPDLASWLVEHRSQLTDDEVMQHLRVILVAAHETSTSVMANMLRMVLYDPRFQASLAGGQMTVPEAIEQVLWDEPPFLVIPSRIAVADTELAGQRIRAGDVVLLALAAGNVDPVVRPDLTASMRGNRSHLAFSRGPHECPGQEIGRAIVDTGVETLLARLPDIHHSVLEESLSWASSLTTRSLVALPAEFAPQQPRSGLVEDTKASVKPSVLAGVSDTPVGNPEVGPSVSDMTVSTAPQTSNQSSSTPSRSWWRSFGRWLIGR